MPATKRIAPYNNDGEITQITTPSPQLYNIVFEYTNGAITKIELKDGSGAPGGADVLQRVDYTYDSGDLTQVKISKRATADTGATLSVVRYTQYRYNGDHRLTAVFENDAIQRIIDNDDMDDIDDADDILAKADSYGTPDIIDFASRSFEYYTTNPSPTATPTGFSASENLTSRYGPSVNVDETGLVKSETIRGSCAACGGTGAAGTITKKYAYLQFDQGSDLDPNEVLRVVVEDTVGNDSVAAYRTIYGLNNYGLQLRKAFIEQPLGSSTYPRYWCESQTLKTGEKGQRIAEKRMPSAHDVPDGDTAAFEKFLNPFSSGSWSNDTATLNSSAGLTYVYEYDDASGLKTDEMVRKGTGTAYMVKAWDYEEGTNDSLVTAEYSYRTPTTYANRDGSTSDKIGYTYSFYDPMGDHRLVKSRTKTLPKIPTSENGAGDGAMDPSTTMVEYFDSYGRLRWTQDGEGYINYYSYNPITGGLAYMATDVDPGSVSTEVSAGDDTGAMGLDLLWEDWTVGGANATGSKPSNRDNSLPTPLNLVEKKEYDAQGRSRMTTDPGGAEHYTVYENPRTIQFPYWDGTKSLTPISVTAYADGVNTSEVYDVKANDSGVVTASSGEPIGLAGGVNEDDYVFLTRYGRNDVTGVLTGIDRYRNITSGTPVLDTHFYHTEIQYDPLGRKEYTIQIVSGTSSGNRVEQITHSIYDVLGRITQVRQAVSGDTAANSHDMGSTYSTYPSVLGMDASRIQVTVYDDGNVGDGHMTQIKSFFGTGANDYTGANFHRNYRGQLRGIERIYSSGALGPHTVQDVDWQGRVVATAVYDSNSLNWSTVKTTDNYAEAQSTDRRSKNLTAYDGLGRIYKTQRFKISASTGNGSDYFATYSYYDRNGREVAEYEFGGPATETAYDGVGRAYQTRTTVGLATTLFSSGKFQYLTPAPKPNLAGMISTGGGDNRVIEIAQMVYEDENVIARHTFETDHSDTLAAGGERGIDLSTPDYVRRSVYSWYDAADRMIATADYGCGGAAMGVGDWEYTSTIPTRASTAPSASGEDRLLTLFSYHTDSGRQELVTDPNGIKTKTFYDDLGRQLYAVENANLDSGVFDPETEAGTGDASDKSKDRVTGFVYNGLGKLKTLTALDADADGGTTDDDQVTTYLYEDAVGADRVTTEIYPDSTSGTDVVEMTYNLDGSLATRTDQREITLTHSYNERRQLALVAASGTPLTTMPPTVDNSILSIKREYDDIARLEKITSYDDAAGTGNEVNQVQFEYNDLDQVITSYQEHGGAVNTISSNKVQYAYDATSAAGLLLYRHRLEKVIYPDTRTVFYDYNKSSIESVYNIFDRVRAIRDVDSMGDPTDQWAVYDYNGTSRLAVVDYPQVDVKLDYFQGTAGTYAGYDRFGRIKDQYWDGYGTTSDVDRFEYTHDLNSNRKSRDINLTSYPSVALDQLYDYDGLNRLTTFDEGAISGGTISTVLEAQDWTLDALGNWSSFLDTSGMTTNLDQVRIHNDVNEITSTSEAMGSPVWVDPVHDSAGNMTTMPRPANPTLSFVASYDAWNRLVGMNDGTATLAFEYDGLNRRIVKSIVVDVMGTPTTVIATRYYYNTNWQVLEARKEVSDTEDPDPLEQNVWHPYYIDALATRFYDKNTDNILTGTDEGQHYFTHDANFNVTGVVDDTGATIERYHYTPYGELTVLDGNFSVDSNGSDIENPYTYTGRRLDAEIGLYQYRNRYYHARLGRFVSRDPIGYEGSRWNLFRYVENNPAAFTDPTGQIPAWRCRADRDACRRGARTDWRTCKKRGGRFCNANLIFDLTYCNAAYAACMATTDEALVGGACVVGGVVIVCCAPEIIVVGGVATACLYVCKSEPEGQGGGL